MIEFKKPLETEEQVELLKMKDEPKVKEKLILHNLKLVLWVAKKYQKANQPGRELDDLFQEGTIGLMKAIEDYDLTKGSFSNYAMIHVRGSILRAITNKGKTIRIPSYMGQLVGQYKKKFEELEKELGREPTPKEMGLALDLTYNKVIEIMNLIDDPISLNVIIGGEDNDITLEETVPDDGPLIEEVVESKVFIEQFIEEFKDKLPELEFESIRLFYGLDCHEHTFKEIAKLKQKKSIEEIRQAKERGLRAVRRSKFIGKVERELDHRTSFIRSIDYTQPRVKGGIQLSPVERLVLERERIRNRLLKKIN